MLVVMRRIRLGAAKHTHMSQARCQCLLAKKTESTTGSVCTAELCDELNIFFDSTLRRLSNLEELSLKKHDQALLLCRKCDTSSQEELTCSRD